MFFGCGGVAPEPFQARFERSLFSQSLRLFIASGFYVNRSRRQSIGYFKGAGQIARHKAGVVTHMHFKAVAHGVGHLLGLQATPVPCCAVAMAEGIGHQLLALSSSLSSD